ncbi:MAG: chemotaxis protein CheD [Desulfuromonadaceae bacterium]|nr:chemotaxis protein CheD [Desulfuromonas sp.]MDY0185106.1 chemotaxis protein CheD [Desulfuromonadaceae bacterium]
MQHELMPVVYLKPGEYHVTKEPCRIETVLGSCVSVTLYCPITRQAAMNHAMLPVGDDSDRFVTVSLDNMLRRLSASGALIHQLEAKMFGGANSFYRNTGGFRHVGELNVDASLRWLEKNKIRLHNSDTGGRVGRKLVFLSNVGMVYVKRLQGR